VFVLTSFLPATDETDAQLAAIGGPGRALGSAGPGQPLNWVFQCRNEALRTQGRTETRLMAGRCPTRTW
jgi:23S rRNA (cytosine1962-C5)-methyltransferase